jgi:hypothetical protein
VENCSNIHNMTHFENLKMKISSIHSHAGLNPKLVISLGHSWVYVHFQMAEYGRIEVLNTVACVHTYMIVNGW